MLRTGVSEKVIRGIMAEYGLTAHVPERRGYGSYEGEAPGAFRPRMPLPVARMAGAHGPLRADTVDGRQRPFPGRRRRGGVLRTHEDGIRPSRALGGTQPRRGARPGRRLHPLVRPRTHQTVARLDESGTIPSKPGNGCVIISQKTSAAPYPLSDDGGERCGTIVKFMERSRSMK